MTFEASAIILAWVAILLLAFAMSGLLRQVHSLFALLQGGQTAVGPALGSRAPRLDGLDGEAGWLQPTILIFADSNCPSCERILSELPDLAEAHSGSLQFAAVFAKDSNGFTHPHILVLTRESTAFSDFRVTATPFAVAVTTNGRIAGTGLVGSITALEQFIHDSQERMMRS
jgi:thiol-disulfide isomerase/thioredoxin